MNPQDLPRRSAQADLLLARIANITEQTRLLRAEIADLTADLRALSTAIEGLGDIR